MDENNLEMNDTATHDDTSAIEQPVTESSAMEQQTATSVNEQPIPAETPQQEEPITAAPITEEAAPVINTVPPAGSSVIFDENLQVKETISQPAPVPQDTVPQPEPAPQGTIPQPAPDFVQSPPPQPTPDFVQSPPPQPNYYQYQNTAYNGAPGPQPTVEPDISPMSLGNWLVTLLLMMIPCVNIVLLFVWAFGDKSGNLNRRNFAKAQLILLGAVLAIYLFVIIIMTIAVGISLGY